VYLRALYVSVVVILSLSKDYHGVTEYTQEQGDVLKT
jgi:hypothetical protein